MLKQLERMSKSLLFLLCFFSQPPGEVEVRQNGSSLPFSGLKIDNCGDWTPNVHKLVRTGNLSLSNK